MRGEDSIVKMTFRWYGDTDTVPLAYIRQIPGMVGVVSAIYDVPVGEVWPIDRIQSLKDKIEAHGLTLEVIESVPVHEDIKLGKPTRGTLIANYSQTLRNLGACGVKVVCYNFMPVFDWTRTSLEMKLPDGSTTLAFDTHAIRELDVTQGIQLPGWDASYRPEQLKALLRDYEALDEAGLWANLDYFLRAIIPVAKEAGIKMAIHPDDPPWPISSGRMMKWVWISSS